MTSLSVFVPTGLISLNELCYTYPHDRQAGGPELRGDQGVRGAAVGAWPGRARGVPRHGEPAPRDHAAVRPPTPCGAIPPREQVLVLPQLRSPGAKRALYAGIYATIPRLHEPWLAARRATAG